MADTLLTPDDIARFFQIESGGNPNAAAGSYRGLGQFGPREEAHFGINDANRNDRTVQAAAVAQEAAENRARLRTVLGREPTASDYYLAHQQGGAGAAALFGNPDKPAWQAIRPFYGSDDTAKRAILGNIPRSSPLYGKHPDEITSADFSGMWANKFGGAPAAPGTAVAAPGSVPAASPALAGAVAQAQPAAVNPAMAAAALLKGSDGQNPLQKLAGQAMAQAQQAPQAFKFMDSALPPLLPTGPVRPLPLQLPKFV